MINSIYSIFWVTVCSILIISCSDDKSSKPSEENSSIICDELRPADNSFAENSQSRTYIDSDGQTWYRNNNKYTSNGKYDNKRMTITCNVLPTRYGQNQNNPYCQHVRLDRNRNAYIDQRNGTPIATYEHESRQFKYINNHSKTFYCPNLSQPHYNHQFANQQHNQVMCRYGSQGCHGLGNWQYIPGGFQIHGNAHIYQSGYYPKDAWKYLLGAGVLSYLINR